MTMQARTVSLSLPRPGARHGAYPQRQERPTPLWLDIADRLGDLLSHRGRSTWRRRSRFEEALRRCQNKAPLDADLPEAAARLMREGFSPDTIACAQAVIADAAERVLGLRPYASQHLAAFELLGDALVELDTGEGKSLAILMAAATAALARVPVHVVTANDYLARRDAEAAAPLLAALGLTVGAIQRPMGADARRRVYAADVVYATAEEIGFDFLRDRLQAAQRVARPVLRGLCFALIDEADSVLLDHARTPLVLATDAPDDTPDAALEAAWAFSARLIDGRDFSRDGPALSLHPAVLDRLADEVLLDLSPARDARITEQLLVDALTARHALRRDVDYLVLGDEVVLVDANTGRTLPDTRLSGGMHRMVCVKEGVTIPFEGRVTSRITLDALFGRYLKLGGVSGTLRESRAALWLFHRLPVRRVEPRVPSRRQDLGKRVCTSRAVQFDLVTERVRECIAAGRPVLVGTDSVSAADMLSAHLAAAGIAHALLTARDDAREAALIGAAGAPGAVTVATSIAGRGSDIALAAASLAAGGLHVVSCAQHGSARIERQLFGRAARNGQPGSSEAVLSLADADIAGPVASVLGRLADTRGVLPASVGASLTSLLQELRAWHDLLRCWQLVRRDRLVRQSLVFAPRIE